MLTNSELKQIKDYLALYGKKDSQLSSAVLPLNVDDKVVILQGDANKLVTISELAQTLEGEVTYDICTMTDYENLSKKVLGKLYICTYDDTHVLPSGVTGNPKDYVKQIYLDNKAFLHEDTKFIYDEEQKKYQKEINQEVQNTLNSLSENKADKSDTYTKEKVDTNIGDAVLVETERATGVESNLSDRITALQTQDIEVVDTLPVSDIDPKKIYRVQGETSYTDYMYQDGDWKELATYSFPGIDEEPTAESDNLVKSGGIKKQFNSLYSITTNILEDVSFTVGRVVSGHVYSQYTDWKYLKFNAIKGDIITYRAQCNNAIILGKYYSDSNVVTIVTGTSDNVVNGTYIVLENGTYTFCVYSSYNDSILTKTSKGDIQTLLDESARKTDLNDYNISLHQINSDSTSPRYNTNLFTLEEAIAQVPTEYQHGGLRLTFFQEDTPPLVHTYTLNTKNWSNVITYWVNDVNGTYSKIIDILNQATFVQGRVVDNQIYTHYTEWKYFIFDAKEGDVIFYRSSCGNAYVLGRYYSNTNITMLVDGNTSTIVTGTYVIPATGKYTFCKYSSYNSPILCTKTVGDIPILQEKVENLEDTVVKSSELEEKPVVYTNSILTSIKNKVDLANTFIKELELIDVPDYSEGQLVIGQMYFYGRTSSAIRWINRIMLRQNGSTTWQYDFEINLFEAPTTEFKTITKTHVKVTWDLYNLYAYRNQVSAENGFALNYTDTSDQYPYILRNYPETAPEKLISGRCIEDDSLNEEKLSASVRTKLNSAGNYINLLENKKIVSLGDSLSVSGVWQEVLVDRCKSIFDSTKNSYLSVGGTKTLDLTNTCGQRRAKKLVEDSGIVPDYIFIENVNDYIITPPPYHNTPTDINDEPFFLTTIYEVGTTFNNKSQATTYFTNNFNQLTTDFDAVKGGAIKLPYNTAQFNLTVANAPTSSGSFTVVTSNGESKSIACTGSETIEQVVNKIAEYSFEGWVVTKVSSSVVSFVPEDSTYTLSITDNTTGVVINITSSTSTYSVDKYFCSVDAANWTNSSYWKNHPGLYASYKGLVEYLQNNFPLANIIILIPEAFQLNYNAQQYKRPDGTRNVDALYSYDYLGYLYNIQISFAERYRLRIIDLRGKCGINYINIQDFQPINNVHPYDSGYRRWGEEIVREIA